MSASRLTRHRGRRQVLIARLVNEPYLVVLFLDDLHVIDPQIREPQQLQGRLAF